MKKLVKDIEENYDSLLKAFEVSEEYSKDPPGYLMTLRERLSLVLGEEGAAALILLLNNWDTDPIKDIAKNNKKLMDLLLMYGERVRLKSRMANWDESLYKVGVVLLIKSVSQAPVMAVRMRILKSNLEPVTIDLPVDEYINFLASLSEPLEEVALHQYLKSLPPPIKEMWIKKIRNVKERLSVIEKILSDESSSFM